MDREKRIKDAIEEKKKKKQKNFFVNVQKIKMLMNLQ